MSEEIVSVDEQLKKFRSGNQQELKLVFGELEVPCRLMSAGEEAVTIAKAKMAVKAPQPEMKAHFEGIEIQKQILQAATFVESTPFLGREFLDKLNSSELESLYDQYMTLQRTVNPKFENLTQEQLVALVMGVKKKEQSSKDLYTWQLAEIGRFYLDKILPTVKEAGS